MGARTYASTIVERLGNEKMISAFFTWKGWFIAGFCCCLVIWCLIMIPVSIWAGWPRQREKELERYIVNLEAEIHLCQEALKAKEEEITKCNL